MSGALDLLVACKAGAVAAIVHHFTCQYPRQATLYFTLCFWGGANCLMLGLICLSSSVTTFSDGITNVVVFNSVYISGFVALKLIYNIFFRHRGIPTELEFCATDWGIWKYSRSMTTHLKIAELHKKYGDVVRIQPNHISFRSLQAMRDIHSSQSKAFKGGLYSYVNRLPKAPASIATSSDKVHHANLRKLVAPLLNSSAVLEFEPTVKQYGTQLLEAIQQVAEENNNVVDMSDWFGRFAFDVGGAITFNQNFGALEGGEPHFVLKIVQRSLLYVKSFVYVPWLAQFLHHLPSTNRMVAEGRYASLEFARTAINRLRKDGGEYGIKTLIASIMEAVDPQTGERYTEKDVLANANSFIVASSDTTAETLTFLLYHLVSNTALWNRLSQDIRSKFASIDEITNLQLSNIQFLDAIIYETLRLRPAVPSNLQREVPEGGMIIEDRLYPEGTTVSTPQYTILHHEGYFSNPEKFIPTRWIEAEMGKETCNKAAWVPFSMGPRNCVGKAYLLDDLCRADISLALAEIRLVIAMFVWSFDATLAEEGQCEPYYKDSFAVARGPLPISILRVKRGAR